MAARCGRDRDRDLGQRPGNREQDDAAERLAEIETAVDRVGRLREGCPGDPGRDSGCA
jgi:phosphohistidine phosphatase SixA